MSTCGMLSRAIEYAQNNGHDAFLVALQTIEADASLPADEQKRRVVELINRYDIHSDKAAVPFIASNCVRRPDGLFEKRR